MATNGEHDRDAKSLNFCLGLLGAFFLIGCTSAKPPESNVQAEGKTCEEPENPYTEGTGHHAGYEWAETKGTDNCDGSSQSFNEGCEEYESQDSEYEECVAKKAK